jgi:hypothetical protein
MTIARSVIAILLKDIQLKSLSANIQDQLFLICHQFEEHVQENVIHLAVCSPTNSLSL